MRKPVGDAVRFLDERTIAQVVRLIRLDPVLGRGTYSSWEEVAPSDFEAEERVATLIQDGIVPLPHGASPEAILAALRTAEDAFWTTS